MINGWEACNRYDEPQTDGLELYVYRITRSSGILLKQIHLPLSFIGHPNLLLEPFLIMFDGNDVFEVHNLLEPKKAPMTIKRSEYIIDVDFGFWAGSKYESDILPNGKLSESILFPVVYQPNNNSFCFDCVEIGRSETGIPDFFVSTRVRFLIQTLNEKNLRPNEKRARLYEWTPISHAQ